MSGVPGPCKVRDANALTAPLPSPSALTSIHSRLSRQFPTLIDCNNSSQRSQHLEFGIELSFAYSHNIWARAVVFGYRSLVLPPAKNSDRTPSQNGDYLILTQRIVAFSLTITTVWHHNLEISWSTLRAPTLAHHVCRTAKLLVSDTILPAKWQALQL